MVLGPEVSVSQISVLRIQKGKRLAIHCGIPLGVWETQGLRGAGPGPAITQVGATLSGASPVKWLVRLYCSVHVHRCIFRGDRN